MSLWSRGRGKRFALCGDDGYILHGLLFAPEDEKTFWEGCSDMVALELAEDRRHGVIIDTSALVHSERLRQVIGFSSRGRRPQPKGNTDLH